MKKLLALGLSLALLLSAAPALAESSARLTDAVVTYTFARGENAAQPIIENSPSFVKAAEITGVMIEMMPVPGGDYATKMAGMFASNTLPDIFVPFGNTREQVEAGALLPLKDLVAQYAPNIQKILDETPNIERTMIDGEYYTLPRIRRDENYEKGCVGFIRVDLLEKNGLPMPATWDEWYETMKTLKALYPDMIMYTARGDSRLIGRDNLSPVRSLGGNYNMYIDGDGVWRLGRIEDDYKNVVTFYKKLYDEGILDPEYLMVNLQMMQEYASSGKAMFWYDNPTFVSGINEALKTVDPEARFEPVPLLANAKGERVNYVHNDHYMNSFAFSSKVKNPELLIKFFDWAYGEEGTLIFNYGIEGDTYAVADGKAAWTPKTIEKYRKMDNSFYKLQSDYGLGDVVFSPSWLYTIYDAFKTTSGEGAVDSLYIHNLYKDESGLLSLPMDPPFTAEESERLTEIKQEIDDYSRTTINQMVMGEVPLEDFDGFVQTLISRGAQEMIDIYNAAEQRLQAEK